MCPVSSYPNLLVTHYINWGNYFLDTQYVQEVSSNFIVTHFLQMGNTSWTPRVLKIIPWNLISIHSRLIVRNISLGIGRSCQRAPGLGKMPRQKSLDSSLAAAHLALQGSTHQHHHQGSVSNLYNQWVPQPPHTHFTILVRLLALHYVELCSRLYIIICLGFWKVVRFQKFYKDTGRCQTWSV